jgi:hypothetical protein
MELSDRVQHFEHLCHRVSGGGDVPAQKELVALRETGSVEVCLAIARSVLDKQPSSTTPVVHFEALSVLESAVLRSPQNSSLAVMRYLLERTGSYFLRDEKAVTRKALHVIATVYKRSFQPSRVEVTTEVDCSPSEFREELWHVLAKWLADQVRKKRNFLLFAFSSSKMC